VTVGLEQPEIKDWVTGKFVMQVLEDADRDEYLSVTVELSPGHEPLAELSRQIAQSIRTQLLRLNSEFSNYVPAASQLPAVTLKPTGDPEFFPAGVKHRYTR
jgi:phenylacetate-CoA ligase